MQPAALSNHFMMVRKVFKSHPKSVLLRYFLPYCLATMSHISY